jgi:hypothetical protein
MAIALSNKMIDFFKLFFDRALFLNYKLSINFLVEAEK